MMNSIDDIYMFDEKQKSMNIDIDNNSIHFIYKDHFLIQRHRVDIKSKYNIFLSKLLEEIQIINQKEEELKKAIAFLQNKESSFDDREYNARQILIEQVDDLRAEEVLISKLEQSNNEFLHLNQNLCSKPDSQKDNENENIISKILNIESNNIKKKNILQSYKQKIEFLKQSFTNPQQNQIKECCHPKYNESKFITKTLVESKHRKSEFEEQFLERKKKLELIQKQIKIYEENSLKKRKQMEYDFNAKISKIEDLTQKLLNIKNDIRLYKSQNLQDKIRLINLQQEKGVLIRQTSKALRDIRLSSFRNSSIENKLQLIEGKKKIIVEKEKELENKKQNISTLQTSLSSQEHGLVIFEQKVKKLEKQVIELENQNNIVFNKMKIAQEAKFSIIKNHQNNSNSNNSFRSNKLQYS